MGGLLPKDTFGAADGDLPAEAEEEKKESDISEDVLKRAMELVREQDAAQAREDDDAIN